MPRPAGGGGSTRTGRSLAGCNISPMFIGHFALGFAAKPAVPRVSLAALLLAALFADVLWPCSCSPVSRQVRIAPGNTAFTPLEFVSYPWSHSLACSSCGGPASVGSPIGSSSEDDVSFVVLALLVVSHWVLDWVTHAPDMPLYPGGPRLGLALWNSMPGDDGCGNAHVCRRALPLHPHHPGDRSHRPLGICVDGGHARSVIYLLDSLSRHTAPVGKRDLHRRPRRRRDLHVVGVVDGQA